MTAHFRRGGHGRRRLGALPSVTTGISPIFMPRRVTSRAPPLHSRARHRTGENRARLAEALGFSI